MTTQLITRNYNDLTFTFRADGYFNMTKAAACFGKRLQDFMDNKETTEYMDALTHANQRELTFAKAGRYGGTFAHPKLAIFFARWLDVRFAVWCDATMGHSPQLDLGRRHSKHRIPMSWCIQNPEIQGVSSSQMYRTRCNWWNLNSVEKYRFGMPRLRNILKIRGPTSSIPTRRSPRGPLGCPRMIEGGA